MALNFSKEHCICMNYLWLKKTTKEDVLNYETKAVNEGNGYFDWWLQYFEIKIKIYNVLMSVLLGKLCSDKK